MKEMCFVVSYLYCGVAVGVLAYVEFTCFPSRYNNIPKGMVIFLAGAAWPACALISFFDVMISLYKFTRGRIK